MKPTAQTITVSSSKDLTDAYKELSAGGGGTILVEQGDERIGVELKKGGDGYVSIRSADSADPVELHWISINDASNISVSDFTVNSDGVQRPVWHQDLMVNGGKNISISDIDFSSVADGRYDPYNGENPTLGERFAFIRNSEDITFEDNHVSNYYHGLTVFETVGMEISGNEFTQMQGDGIRMAGVQDMLIEDNYLHNFFGITNTINHDDFIQLWSINTVLTSKDITITGNVLDSGDGETVQAIFLGNDRFRAGEDHIYENITISENLIRTSNPHGITVQGGRDIDVLNNTVLLDDTTVIQADGEGASHFPRIRLETVESGLIDGNIVTRIIAGDGVDVGDNAFVSNASSADATYADLHFDGVTGAGSLTPESVKLFADSDKVGLGSRYTDPGFDGQSGPAAFFGPRDKASDPAPVVIDLAPESIRELGDMVMPEGDRALDLAFGAGGVTDRSGFATSVVAEGATAAGGFAIGGEDRLLIDRKADQTHALDAFAIEIDLATLDADGGRFLQLHKALEGRMHDDGTVSFTLETDRGEFTVDSGAVSFADGASHTLGFYYDGTGLALAVDGTALDYTAASGTTGEYAYHGLTIGSWWEESLEADVTGFRMATELPATFLADAEADATEAEETARLEAEALSADPRLIELAFGADGVDDLSRFDTSVVAEGATAAGGFAIGGEDRLLIDRKADQTHALDAFAIEIDLATLDADGGRFLQLHKALEGRMHDDGTVSFTLETDRGEFTVDSGAVSFADGASHTLGFYYDGTGLALAVDGTALDYTAASGTTGEYAYHGLTIGSWWEESLEADVAGFRMETTPPASIMQDAQATLLFAGTPVGSSESGIVVAPFLGEEDENPVLEEATFDSFAATTFMPEPFELMA